MQLIQIFLVSGDCEKSQQSKQHHRQIFEMMKEKQRGVFYAKSPFIMYFSCKCLVDSCFKFIHQLIDEMKKNRFFLASILLV